MALHQTVQGILHQTFRFGVQGACGLVQDHHRRVFEHRPCNVDALFLAARKFVTAVAYIGIIALWQLHNKIVRIGHFGRLNDFLVGGIRFGQSDIIAHRVVEQNGFLRYDGHQVAQIPFAYITDINAVNRDLSTGYVIKPHQQMGNGGFPTPRLPHQSHCGSLGHPERHIAQNLVGFVTERYIFQTDFPFEIFFGNGIRFVPDFFVGFHNFEHTLGRCHPPAHGITGTGNVFGRREHIVGQGHKGNKHRRR